MIQTLGFIAAVVMPLWNIPLMLRIGRRKSSGDISAAWVLGVYTCILLMLPSGLASPDPTFKAFAILNVALFSGVVIQVLRYRTPPR